MTNDVTLLFVLCLSVDSKDSIYPPCNPVKFGYREKITQEGCLRKHLRGSVSRLI